MRRKNLLGPLLLLMTVALMACKKNEQYRPQTPTPPVSEEEVITTVEVTFSHMSTGLEYVLLFRDTDGPGGNDPVITVDGIPGNGEYTMNLRVLNESASPPLDLTAEISDEDDEHQFFFAVTGAALSIQYADLDANDHPVGLLNFAQTGEAGTGTLTITLRHGLDKGASGVAQGDITNAGGDTDIEVTFPVEVL
jgi:hypothetical protein